MFLDLNPDRFWEETPFCKSCRQPILSEHSTEQLQVPFDAARNLHELNGLYHSECAKPFLSIVRALNALSRGPF